MGVFKEAVASTQQFHANIPVARLKKESKQGGERERTGQIRVYRWAVTDMPIFDGWFVCTVSENLFTGLSL